MSGPIRRGNNGQSPLRHDGIDDVKIGRSVFVVKARGEGLVAARHGYADPLLEPAAEGAVFEVEVQASNGHCFAASYPKAQLAGIDSSHTRLGVGC